MNDTEEIAEGLVSVTSRSTSPVPYLNSTVLSVPLGTTQLTANDTFHDIDDEGSAIKESHHFMFYVLVFLGSLGLVFLLSVLILFLVRKSRLDKLRHHLMPLYNFDPAEEGEDWESELLEEGMDHRFAGKGKDRSRGQPKLAFDRDAGL